jgi:2-polyprenyl-3-methyl-5-hydroxy-6-metoxy-1,4-benzoquinol methylase
MSTTPIGRPDEALRKLKALSTSPHDPEPPVSHPLVTLAVRLANRNGDASLRTPHLSHGSNQQKVEYEYAGAPGFLQAMAGWLTPDAMRGLSVLDVGCGWGGKAVYFAEHHGPSRMEGFDLPGVFDPAAPLEFAEQRGVRGCAFRTGYAEAIPYGEGEFDLLLCEDVLEHVADPGRVLQECRRVLRAGGRLVALFPSFRMLNAHHLDRALTWPGLHYLLSMKAWAAGLNHYLLAHEAEVGFEPFSETRASRFHRCVMRDLNGMSFSQFGALARESGLSTEALRLLPLPTPDNGRSVLLKKLYRSLWRVPLLTEVISERILYVARKR